MYLCRVKNQIMKKIQLIILSLFFGVQFIQAQGEMTTICNPLNLSYMFSGDKPSYREAADPSLVLFQGEYYLFISKSGGYFHSTYTIRKECFCNKFNP
jgi:hypothetical protein